MNLVPQSAELYKAIIKLQSKLGSAPKTSANPHFRSKYADLAECWDTLRTPLAECELCVIQSTLIDQNGVVLQTTLAHSSGQSVTSFYPVRPVKDDPQGMGSALTYARRYSLAAITGLTQADDDGNAASFPQVIPQAKLALAPSAAFPDEFVRRPDHLKLLREACTSLKWSDDKIKEHGSALIGDLIRSKIKPDKDDILEFVKAWGNK